MKYLKCFALLLPLCLSAATPIFYMPMDESADVIGADGKKLKPGIVHGRVTYPAGVIGKAADVKRHAYDQVGAVFFENLPAIDCNRGTVSFWFKPHWKETDPEGHWILYADTWKKFRFYFIKGKNGTIELSICAPGQIQFLKKNILKQNEWAHIAFSWDTKTAEARLYVNGRLLEKKTNTTRFQALPDKHNLRMWLGQNSADRFKAVVGNGSYDEIKYFDHVLTPEEVFSLASGGAAETLKKLGMEPVTATADRTSFVLSLKEGRYPGPKKFLVLNGSNPKHKLSFVAMGASGKISLIAECGGKTATLESPYILRLNEPHRIELIQQGNKLSFLLDGARQGALELSSPFGRIVSAEGVEGVSFLPQNAFPAKEETVRISDSAIRPVEKSLWDLSDAERTGTEVRKGVTLNGYWRVIPVNDYSYAPPAGEWGYMRVPGSFRSPLYNIHTVKNGKLVPVGGWSWNKKSLITYRAGWYQRVFEIPADFKKDGGRVYLNFTNLNTDYGRVYLNGKLIDSFRQDFKSFPVIPNTRRLDVTDDLAGNGKNVITLFLDRAYVGLWRGTPSIGDHSEIALDDVWLEKAPSKVFLSKAVAMPSFRKKEVHFRARISNPAGLKGEALLRFDFDFNGKDRKSFREKFALDGKPEQVVVFTDSWKNPVLWDVENPNLYKMTVSLDLGGRKIDALPSHDFGFREAWVENGEFRMNGKKMRMRMWSSPGLNRLRFYYGNPKAVGQYVAHIKKMNYDTVRFDPYGKSTQVCWPDYLKASDRQGLYNLFQMIPYEDEELKGYTGDVTRFLEHYGNHPSILMWYTDFNTCGYPWDQDPAKLNDTEYFPVSKRQARARTQVAEKVMRSLDPSRELFQHAGGNSGKIFTSMNYQSFGTPLQEQEDWPRQWSEKHTQPLMVVECAFPYPMQFWHFDNPDLGSLNAEHAARYFGDQVYSKEHAPIPNANSWLNSPYANWPKNMQALAEMLYRKVVPAWRAYDMSALGDFPGGRDKHHTARTYNNHKVVYEVDNNVKTSGIKPEVDVGWSETQKHLLTDYTRPEAMDDAVRTSFAPLLVFLGGMPSDFTNKDHAFYSGETFEKSAVAVNDHTTSRTLTFRWELVSGGKTLDQGEFTRTVEPGGIGKFPIALTAPKVYKRTDAELRLMALQNDQLLKEDSFRLQFFPKRAAPDFSDVSAGLYDPEGKTELLLKKAGFPFRKVQTLADLKKCRLLIIGQNALKDGNPEFLKQAEEAGLIENGLKILLFEQKQCNLGNLVFESPSYRNAFIRRPGSPYLAGLKEEDFSNWRGDSDTVPAFVLGAENSPHYPRSKWKCGNGGIVSGNVIRKPSYGNFQTIVDSGFNLMFASLMELRKGHGLVLFCQLDVTSRYGKDPAATKLVDNLLTEMGSRFVPVGPQRVGYLGNKAGEELLRKMGMTFTRATMDRHWELGGYQVLILGPDAVPENKKDLFRKFFVQKNPSTAVVALPGAPLELLPGELKLGQKSLFRASVPKTDPLFEGIPEADLYFREARKLPVLTSAPDWMVATSPALFAKLDRISTAIVVLTLGPEDISGLWNQEKIARVWSAIFSNMNIGLGKDLKLFTSPKSRHNTLRSCFGEIAPEKCGIRFDLKNDGTVSDTAGFRPVKLGLSWESQGFQQTNPHYQYPAKAPAKLKRPYDGYAWYRCTVKIPASWKGHRIRLAGGPIDDCDWTYWNGTKIGETTFDNNPEPYKAMRNYPIPENRIKFGADNTLMIRVFDRWGEGGVTGPLKVIAEDANASDSWSPYVEKLNFYDGDAFHNW